MDVDQAGAGVSVSALAWALARAYWKPLAFAAVLLAAAAGIGWWGHGRYEQGRADERAEAKLAQIAIEQGMQYEADRADAEYRGAVLAREAALGDLSAVRGQLDRLLDDARHAETARTLRGSDAAGPDWIGGFSACYSEYADLAADAARWADQVNGLQGYVRALRK